MPLQTVRTNNESMFIIVLVYVRLFEAACLCIILEGIGKKRPPHASHHRGPQRALYIGANAQRGPAFRQASLTIVCYGSRCPDVSGPALPVPRPGRDREVREYMNMIMVPKDYSVRSSQPNPYMPGLGQGHEKKKTCPCSTVSLFD